MTKLNDIPPKNPFKVPDNYFDEVNRKIITAASDIEPEVRKISIYNRFRTSILVAASVAGFIILSYSAVRLFTSDRSDSTVSEVLHEINPDSLINDIDIFSLEESASSLIVPQEGPDVSKKDIIDYLLLENVEINDIYERL
jgi:hypothetical protein